MTTIESHYEKLRKAAQGDPRGDIHLYAKRIASRATEIAEADWPSIRSSIAAAGSEMPPGPRRFNTEHGTPVKAYTWGPWEKASVCSSRTYVKGEPERDYCTQAEIDLSPLIRREHELRVAEFEAYRRAVEQGVAIAPKN